MEKKMETDGVVGPGLGLRMILTNFRVWGSPSLGNRGLLTEGCSGCLGYRRGVMGVRVGVWMDRSEILEARSRPDVSLNRKP